MHLFKCKHCSWSGMGPDYERRPPHLGAFCPKCGRWIKWVTQEENKMSIVDGTKWNRMVNDYEVTTAVDEYKGQYSITSCWIGQEGDVRANWCCPVRGKGPVDVNKKIPLSVRIGSATDAPKYLRALANAIERATGTAGTATQPRTAPPVDDLDIPF